jgi:acetyltransferase-like isoleucine patch superfamily enzyme
MKMRWLLFKQYGFWGLLTLIKDLIITKLRFPEARIIRFPFDFRGRSLIRLGLRFTSGRYCRLEAHDVLNNGRPVLIFGADCQINDFVHIAAGSLIEIGNNVLIASRVFITDLNHGSYSGVEHSFPESIVVKRKLFTSPVKIHNNVWLGEGVTILPGVEIGENSIIGANSVVTKYIPANSIACGNPAFVIKVYDVVSNSWVRD